MSNVWTSSNLPEQRAAELRDVQETSRPVMGARMARSEVHDEIEYCERCGISFLWSAEERQRDRVRPLLCPGCRELLPKDARERGAVKWFSPSKHYGFITRRTAEDVFVHRSQVKRQQRLRPGDLVEFGIESGDKGLNATDVMILARADELEQC